VAEVVEMRAQPLPEFEQLRPLLFELVERGMLPRPEALAGDPALQQRTLANGVNSSEAVDLLPASFPIDTRRSDGHTILTRALAQGRADIVRRALARGANPNLCAPRACPLELALGVRDDARAWDLLELLLRAGADANQLDPAQHALTLPLAAAAARGLWRTPRTRGNAACAASTCAASARSSQACATIAFGMPCAAASALTQRVSPTGSCGSHSAST